MSPCRRPCSASSIALFQKPSTCREDIAFEAFEDVYLQAYALGCKGCTTYRPNPITGAVLSTEEPTKAKSEATPKTKPAAAAESVVYMTQPLDRPEAALAGQTYKLRWPESNHAIYITINDVVQDERRRPFEIFINSKNMEHYAWTLALTRMISAVFRRGGDVSFVVEELKAVFDPRGGAWLGGRYVPSLSGRHRSGHRRAYDRHRLSHPRQKAWPAKSPAGEAPEIKALGPSRWPGQARYPASAPSAVRPR